MGKYYSIIGGLVAMIIGIICVIAWFPLFIKALIVTIPSILLLGGLIAFIAGISELKDSAASKESTPEEETKEETKEEAKSE
ncbi:hypothetical protein ACFL1T_03690 [Chlamydiota bacterium]